MGITAAKAQDFDALLTATKHISCEDIAANASTYFIKAWEQQDAEQIEKLLVYWEKKCSLREPVFRAKLLYAIANHKFADTMLVNGSMNLFSGFEERSKAGKQLKYFMYDDYKSYFGFVPIGQEFDQFTQKIADSLLKRLDPNTAAYSIARFYSGSTDSLHAKLYKQVDSGVGLALDYEEKVKQFKAEPAFHYALFGGLWVPTGDIKPLGNHPELGLLFGGKHHRLNFDLSLGFKFIRSANPYYFTRKWDAGKPLDSTDYFSGFNLGLAFAYDLIQKEKYEWQLLAGIAYDGFMVEPSSNNNRNNYRQLEASSYNFNFGLAYRYYVTKTSYVGLTVKYNIVDYRLSNVVNFTGNPLSIHLVYGGVANLFQKDMDRLGYRKGQ